MTAFEGITVDEFMEYLGLKRIYVDKLMSSPIQSLADMSDEDKEKMRQAQQERYKILCGGKITSNKASCLHNQCSDCGGSGRKKNGQPCVHILSCKCPKCSPSDFMNFEFSETDICIYHRNCGDGFCCAWLVWSTVGGHGSRDIEYIALNPSTKINDRDLERFAGKNVLIVDLSFSEDDLLDIQKVAKSVLVLDHHKTAEKFLKNLDFAVFDQSECGASLLYRFLYEYNNREFDHSSKEIYRLPTIVQYVKDRDLWNWDLDHSHGINAYLQTLPFEFEIWDEIAKELDSCDGFEKILDKGVMILETQNRMANELAECSNLVDLYLGPEREHTIKARVVNCSVRELISITGHQILELEEKKPKNERVEIAIMYTIFPDGGLLYSVRSVPSFDVSVIAVAWGGGGHANACGFKGRLEEGFPWLFEKD